MKARSGLGHRAQRTEAYAESRFTNWRVFSPGDTEAMRVEDKFRRDLESAKTLIIRSVPVCSPQMLMPVTEKDVAEALDAVPARFLRGLRAVFLLGGSRKQERVGASRLFAFGRYGDGIIFLYPFPMAQMRQEWKTLPKPTLRREYERAGAVWEKTQDGWALVFTPDSRRDFYRRDALLHEIGHHVDRSNRRSRRDSEASANWVAIEYGFARKGAGDHAHQGKEGL